MAKILIVDDEEKLSLELKMFLESNGYEAYCLDKFNNTIDEIVSSDASLVLLDINIPNLNGEIVCKEVRKKSSIPIIIVTSRNNEIDELLSINYGADDFITKPYNTQILLARIERILSRSNQYSNVISINDLIIDLNKSIIKHEDTIIDLSKNEISILAYLVNKKGIIVSRDELMNYLWDTNEFIDDNTLTVNINRLRNKLTDIGYSNLVVTKRGQGYIIL